MSTVRERWIRFQRCNELARAALGAAYWPSVLLPLVLWRWSLAELPLVFRLVPVLGATFFVPLFAGCFFMGRRKRLRLAVGFALYASCYLFGNALGLVGARWYWLHFTMLSFVLFSGVTIGVTRAPERNPVPVRAIKIGNWVAALSFLALVFLRARVGLLIVWDYLMGIYFALCAWEVSSLQGLEEDAA